MADYGALPFAEQIAFFRRKLDIPTRAWTDLTAGDHDHGFMVAGAVKRDLLRDLRGAVDQAISKGATLAQFRRDFDPIVQRYGWAYNGGRNWRTRVIYQTNLRQSYNAGRHAQMLKAADSRPYWRYRHMDGEAHPRPQHQAWDGIVLHYDDPWWATHQPQNGWGCKCTIETLGARDLARMGKKGPDRAPPIEWVHKLIGRNGPSPRTVRVPEGVDPGFGHAPGAGWIKQSTPRVLAQWPATIKPVPARRAPDLLPAPRAQPADAVLPDHLDPHAYVAAFLGEFKGRLGPDGLFADAAGDRIPINDGLFRDAQGNLKITKRGRHPYVRLLARALMDPDEVWVSLEPYRDFPGRYTVRRRYIAGWALPGEAVQAVSVFELGDEGWIGTTAFRGDDPGYLERHRSGVRLYRRKK